MAATLWELFFVTVCAVVALAGLALVRRTRAIRQMETHHEAAGFLIGIVGLVYAVLLAFVTVAFTYLFQLSSLRLQVFMTAEVVDLIALVLFLVIALSKPLAGAVRLSPDPFQRQLALITAQSAR
jgi:hypothetical protein